MNRIALTIAARSLLGAGPVAAQARSGCAVGHEIDRVRRTGSERARPFRQLAQRRGLTIPQLADIASASAYGGTGICPATRVRPH